MVLRERGKKRQRETGAGAGPGGEGRGSKAGGGAINTDRKRLQEPCREARFGGRGPSAGCGTPIAVMGSSVLKKTVCQHPARSFILPVPAGGATSRPGPDFFRAAGASRKKPALNFSPRRLFSIHADLRISLREMRARQRNPRPLDGLEKDRVSALRLEEIVQEILHVCRRVRRFRKRGIIARQRRRPLLRRGMRLPLNPRHPELRSSRKAWHDNRTIPSRPV